jgi:hypothetical protein
MDTERGRYWFAAKRYGWGWGLPLRWEGWVVMAVWLAVIVVAAILFAGRAWGMYAGLVGVATAGLVGICWWKGEPARWRWGE